MDTGLAPTNTIDLLEQLVAEETSRKPTEREMKRFKGFNGAAPHLRPGPRRPMQSMLSVREIIATRAVLVHLLIREYGLHVSDARAVLRCEDDLTVEKLLALGDEIAPASSFAAQLKRAVCNAAENILDSAPPVPTKKKLDRLVKPSQAGTPRLNNLMAKKIRQVLAYLLREGFNFRLVDIAPLLGYPTREAIRMLQCVGERLLTGSHREVERAMTLQAARSILERSKS